MKILSLSLITLSLLLSQNYSWLNEPNNSKLLDVIKPNKGFVREVLDTTSFAYWLRNFPINTKKKDVELYNGDLKRRQYVHHSILKIDVGKRNLQQCADAVMRLRAEYLYSIKKLDNISFNFTSGDKSTYRNWMKGIRAKVNGNKVKWVQTKRIGESYKNFRAYLDIVFMYAGTY